MRLYLSGPMSGMPGFNIPEFDRVAGILRGRRHEVISPAELDDPQFRSLCLECEYGGMDELHALCEKTGIHQDTWGDLLARDVKLLADDHIQGVVVLQGWMHSRGALLETYVARLCGIPIFYPSFTAQGTPQDYLVKVPESELEYAHRQVPGAPAHDAAVRTLTPGEQEHVRKKARKIIQEHRHNAEKVFIDEQREVRVTSETGGQKGSKPAVLGDLCPKALKQLAEVAGFGRRKYDRLNYLKGFAWSLSYDAAQRHLLEFWSGNNIDEESGLPHLAHAAWQCLCLLAFQNRNVGKDDRP